MKPLTCPNCKMKYPKWVYYYDTLRLREAEFDCVYCETRLGFNIGRRFLLLLVSFTPIAGSTVITKYLANYFEISTGFAYLIFITFLLLLFGLMLQYDTFRKIPET